MTIAELEIILSEGFDFQEELIIRHADLKTAILNAPRMERKDKRLWKVMDFLPKSIKDKLSKISEAEQVERIKARGDAVAAKCQSKAAERKK